MTTTLPPVCRFFPLANGVYTVDAGLRPLGTSFGNGAADAKTFLIDTTFEAYRAVKLQARTAQLEAYYPPSHELDPQLYAAVVRFLAQTLAREYPEHITLQENTSGFVFRSALSGDELEFTKQGMLQKQSTRQALLPPYRDTFDALACQVQEDLSIWSRRPETGTNWLSAIHLCFPNHWAAEDKIGRDFNAVHFPVAEFQRLAKAAPKLVEAMVQTGPYVRFAWGVATDTALNHHPHLAAQGRSFSIHAPELYLRIERQTLTPFPQQHGSLFTIRTYFLNCATDLNSTERAALCAAIRSMTPASVQYKGLTTSIHAVLEWLQNSLGALTPGAST